ncbi:ribosomal-protein-alanine N-acetyltransferase [Marmoricola sp. OAE513]|uniref:GNAT family N-acetyltransferase n=1 Tax=Marmoricola sp. OAE513 TaxID=2817894 RepID=UPI001AE766BD
MIRPANPADAGAIAVLEAECQGVDAWSAALVEDGVTGDLPTIQYLVSEDGGSLNGYAVASYAGDIAELQRIGVATGARRQGIASALLDAVVAHAPSTGADRMLLEVRADNHGALSFYAAKAFVEIDRRARYYKDGVDAVVMRLPLVAGCGGRS